MKCPAPVYIVFHATPHMEGTHAEKGKRSERSIQEEGVKLLNCEKLTFMYKYDIMRFEAFARRLEGRPVLGRPAIEAVMAGGKTGKRGIAVQLHRWSRSGRLVRLRRGKYLLPPPWAEPPHPAWIANELVYPSYVSLAYALQFHDLIPEGVSVVTSVTTRRPATVETPVGTYRYRHVRRDLFFGSIPIRLGEGEGGDVRIASPEKALLDFLYFESGPLPEARLASYRFQNLDRLDPVRLVATARRFGQTRLWRAAERLARHARKERA